MEKKSKKVVDSISAPWHVYGHNEMKPVIESNQRNLASVGASCAFLGRKVSSCRHWPIEEKRMTTKHTPGPWFFHDGNVYAKKPALLPKLADRSVKIVGYDPKTVFTDKDLSIEEMHANAQLIASAPELLEACQIAAEKLETTGEYPAILAMLNAAKAKAGAL